MREIFQLSHPNITASEYIKQRLLNSDVDRTLANENGYDLKEWFYNRQDRCSIRYSIIVQWTEPIESIIGSKEITVSEKRSFQLDSDPIQVKSTIHTNVKFISATVTHTFENKGGGCIEHLIIDVIYEGGTLKDQIERDFYNAIFPLFGYSSSTNNSNSGSSNSATDGAHSNQIALSTSSSVPKFGFGALVRSASYSTAPSSSSNPSLSLMDTNLVAVPPQNFQAYHSIHDKLEQLKIASQNFSEVVERARINRPPLTLPSADQIARITEIVEPERFSIQDEVQQMRAEAERTKRIVSEIKRSRQQTTGSSSLPMFVLASCAAIIMIVISRSE
ncbi:hypothetical protein M9Y10_035155 [Tritrichomonas musculus]|uniref:VASt domain-containing protein n=1 Tax=Tritrichomonas musculus TaxID=1915356 RepID=A0ABR2KGW9_9EUKA